MSIENTPIDIYIKKLENTILNYCKIYREDYFDIRDLTKFKDRKNILDLIKLYYKLNGIVKIHVRKINKIKPSNDFYYRSKYPFLKRNTLKENIDSIFKFKLKYRDIYLIYDGFYTLIEEIEDFYRVKLFIKEKMIIKFYFNSEGIYIICPNLNKCKNCRKKTLIINKIKINTCHKKSRGRSRGSLKKCQDIKFDYLNESVFPTKICISELYTIYNLAILLNNKEVIVKDSPEKKYILHGNSNHQSGIYIRKTELRYLNIRKPEKNQYKLPYKKKRPHTRIGHWRTYKKYNKRVWINKIEVNQKSDIKKINKTPFII